MNYLIAAVVLIGVLCLLNLVLTLGLLRRLRLDGGTEELRPVGHVRAQGLTQGRRPTPFSVRTLGGERLTEADLADGPTLVGFLSPGCKACAEQTPKFAALAAKWPGGPERVLVVIADDSEAAVEYSRPFEGIARRVVDGLPGAIASAYGVSAYPAFGLLDEEGVVVAEATSIDSLPAPVPADA